MNETGAKAFSPADIRELPTRLREPRLFEPSVFRDARGALEETYSLPHYAALGITDIFVQDTVMWSGRHVLRGPHYDPLMAKFVQVLRGTVFDVVVDMREESPTYRQWESFELSDENHHQLYIPAGFAHAFLALTDDVIFHYKMSAQHVPERERRIHWLDPRIGIAWPYVEGVLVSEKDSAP